MVMIWPPKAIQYSIYLFFFFLSLANPFCLIEERLGQNLFSLIALYNENPYNYFNLACDLGYRDHGTLDVPRDLEDSLVII